MSNKLGSVVKVCGILMVSPAIGCFDKGTSNPPPQETGYTTNPPYYETGDTVEPEGNGAEVYSTSCSGCHGADGISGSAPNLADAVPNLSDDQLTDIITNGQGSMPGGLASESDVPALVDYLRTTFP